MTRRLSILLFLCGLPTAPALADPPGPRPTPWPLTPEERARLRPAVVPALDQLAATLAGATADLHLVLALDTSRSMDDDARAVAGYFAESMRDVARTRRVHARLATYDSRVRSISDWDDRLDLVARALAAQKLDGDGWEHPMGLVESLSAAFPSDARERAILILTDETGSDPARLEKAIAVARERKTRVFVIGPEAPFGWPFRYETLGAWQAATDVFAETARPEILQINPAGFASCCPAHAPWCRKSAAFASSRLALRDRGNPLQCDLGFDSGIGSGFGPWPLERLARETGGAFFLLRPSPYAPRVMAPYAPDRRSLQDIDVDARHDPIQGAVRRTVEAWPRPAGSDDRIWARPCLPLSIGEAERPGAVQEALELIRLCDAQEAEMDAVTAPGDGDAGGRRWRANLELVRAQVAALRHYLIQYALVMSASPGDGRGRAILRPGPRRQTKQADAAFDDARRRLGEVVQHHPGTPWGDTADMILNQLGGFALAPAGPCRTDVKTPPAEDQGR